MGRAFTKNASNYMVTANAAGSTVMSGAPAVSFHVWINLTAIDTGANNNRVVNFYVDLGTTGAALIIEGTTGTVRMGARSMGTDGFQTGTGAVVVPLGVWVPIGGVADYANGRIRTYIFGQPDSNTAATFSAVKYTLGAGIGTQPDAVGGSGVSPPTTNQINGNIAEVSAWGVDIGDEGFAELARGVCPNYLRNAQHPAIYWPLAGTDTVELDINSGLTLTTTGTILASEHPDVNFGPDDSAYGWYTTAGATRGLFLPPSLTGLGSGGSFFADRLAG